MKESFLVIILMVLMLPVFIACNNGNRQHSNTANQGMGQVTDDFTVAAKNATPAVVHINTYATVDRQELGMMKRYLRQRGVQEGEIEEALPDDGEMVQTAIGSGVIIESDGLIVTSLHIISEAERIEVTLNDKRVYDAEILGVDPATDLALLRVDDKNLPFLDFGNEDEIEVGEWIAAVGNPFGLTSTVTVGIVSAKGRDINILESETDVDGTTIESFIQTDAAQNPGNSGGALINRNGELIGINAAIASPTGAFAGYSFAVPIDLVKKVVNDVLEFGEVRRGILGLSVRDFDGREAEEIGIEDLAGVLVEDVLPGSAAEEAGIQSGDVILAVEGAEIQTASHLHNLVSLKRPGEDISLVFRRDGDTLESNANLKQ